jgi:two-component system chemotaxis response regulator CheB
MHAGRLPASHPQDGDPITHGRIYIAPPDYHLLVEMGRVRVVRGPRENRHRPAVDPLFRSAARAYGRRVVGVILSGMLNDGTVGLRAIWARGGVGLVQSPDDALFDGMPASAIMNDHPQAVLPVAAIGPELVRLAHEPVPDDAAGAADAAPAKTLETEVHMAEFAMNTIEDPDKPGEPSVYGCPECGGVLWEMADTQVLRYRCRVGHAYTADSLLADQSKKLEDALWAAMRGLEEKASLAHRLGARARESGYTLLTDRYAEQERDARAHATVIQRVILQGGDFPNLPTAQRVSPFPTGEGGGEEEKKLDRSIAGG